MINRPILNKLENEFSHPEIVVLLGPRQVGKTTLLHKLEETFLKRGLKTCFYDLEQPQALAEFNRADREIIDKIKSSGEVVFVDEFQYIKNASKILKAIFDQKLKTKIYCSGSSSLEIHRHLKESLAGRRLLYRVFPLSASEIRVFRADFYLDEYLRYGGMPGVVMTTQNQRRELLLAELVSAYILKDVKSLVKEENLRAFSHFLYLLAQNQGSAVSIHSLSKEVGMSSKALGRYLDILEGTFVNFRVPSFSRNLGNELKKSFKTYLYDLGIRNVLLKDFSSVEERADKGVIYESAVYLRLKTEESPDTEIRFWRTKTGDEVDFVFLKNRKPLPIEVKSRLSGPEIPKGLQLFLLRYPETREAWVINQNIEKTLKHKDAWIKFIPIDKFLTDASLPFGCP